MRKTLFLIAILFVSMSATTADPPIPEDRRITAINRALESTVIIKPQPQLRGSGFFVAPDMVLTNYHVTVQTQGQLIVNPNKLVRGGYPRCIGTVVAEDRMNDLALVKLDTQCPKGKPLTLADSLVAGQDAYAIGNPGKLEWIVSAGIVARPWEDVTGQRLTLLDMRLAHGNSGGPVIDSSGKVIGVARGIYGPAAHLSAAVHLEDIRQFIEEAM